MFQIHFSQVTFAQAAKYVIIVKNYNQTKRSQVCTLWTSVPTFGEPIVIDQLQGLVVKACSATIDRKLTVIGSYVFTSSQLNQSQKNKQGIIYQGPINLTQKIQQKYVCVGTCTIKILKKQPKKTNSQQLQDIDQEFQIKSQDENYQQQQQQTQQIDKCQLKFIIHGGFDFYLNAGFKVRVTWGKYIMETKLVMNRIAPFWGKAININGRQDKLVQISVFDDKNNKLQWLKFEPKQIRIMYPYHLHIKFRQQYVGLHPHFYLTIIRQDVPLYSILDKKIKIKVRYIGPSAPQRTQQYLLIYPKDLEQKQNNRLPVFIELDMKNYINFDTINKIIQQAPDKRYEWSNWNLLFPINLNTDTLQKDYLSLLKSLLNKSLVCIYFHIQDPKSLFCQQIWNNISIIDKRQYFQNNIKDIYYQQKRIIIGKSVQLSNYDIQGLENQKNAISLQQKWKLLTHNYKLRKQLLSKSINNTENIKKQIKQKGQYLKHLKKILIEVKKINQIMLEKQKSSLMEDKKVNKKIRENYSKFSMVQIITSLLQKQVELQKRKKINDQMRMRMDSLHYFTQDSQQLDKILIQNSQKLLQQQTKIKQANKIKQILPKQREVILKMQKLFEKRQIDKSMNQLLIQQQNKLQNMRKLGNKNLEKVYDIVKEHKNVPNSLIQSINMAEKELVYLNAQYAKLVSY